MTSPFPDQNPLPSSCKNTLLLTVKVLHQHDWTRDGESSEWNYVASSAWDENT